MEQQALIPHLFRKGYRKITTVMRKPLGIDYIKIAEEILPAKISFSFFNEKRTKYASGLSIVDLWLLSWL